MLLQQSLVVVARILAAPGRDGQPAVLPLCVDVEHGHVARATTEVKDDQALSVAGRDEIVIKIGHAVVQERCDRFVQQIATRQLQAGTSRR